MTTFRVLHRLLVAALLVSGGTTCTSHPALRSPGGSWIVVNPSPKVTVSLDTSRIAFDSGAAVVWLRFDYVELNPPMQDVPRAWRRMEVREAVDCGRRRAQDRAMFVIDTAGTSYDGTKVLPHGWQPFERHALTVNLFDPLCVVLTQIGARRGA